jgi:hypothetical protein
MVVKTEVFFLDQNNGRQDSSTISQTIQSRKMSVDLRHTNTKIMNKSVIPQYNCFMATKEKHELVSALNLFKLVH